MVRLRLSSRILSLHPLRGGVHKRNPSDFPSTPIDEIIFGLPPSEASPPPFTTLHSVTAESRAPPIQDHPSRDLTAHRSAQPDAYHAYPHRAVTSPVPRPCSCLSLPSSLPPPSRRSPATSPYMRGNTSTSSPSAPSSRPGSLVRRLTRARRRF